MNWWWTGRCAAIHGVTNSRTRLSEVTDWLIISFSTLKIDAHVLLSTSSNSSYSESFQYDIMLSIHLRFLLFLKPHPVFKLYLCSTLKFKRSFRNLIFITINKVGMIVHFIEILEGNANLPRSLKKANGRAHSAVLQYNSWYLFFIDYSSCSFLLLKILLLPYSVNYNYFSPHSSFWWVI